ncbi:MAG: efflux RND transporter periplasmic adaptor subunit [Candidatus Eisenbacteria bacterium]|nr:efflux RND transporter periplasmic adaptor subunit [Candidatus Eisenbacteria bacterium]
MTRPSTPLPPTRTRLSWRRRPRGHTCSLQLRSDLQRQGSPSSDSDPPQSFRHSHSYEEAALAERSASPLFAGMSRGAVPRVPGTPDSVGARRGGVMGNSISRLDSVAALTALILVGVFIGGCDGEAGAMSEADGSAVDDCGGCVSHAPVVRPDDAHAHDAEECGGAGHGSEEPSAHQHDAGCDHSVGASGAVYCGEHDLYEAECGICQPGLAHGLKPGEGLKIRLPSEASEAKAGIIARRPHRGPAATTVFAVGQLEFDQNRLVHVTPLTDGVVRRVFAELGQEVGRGEVLAELTSSGIADAKAQLLAALAREEVASEELARERELFEKEMSSTRHFRDVEARHKTALAGLGAAEQRLLEMGLDRGAIDRTVSEHEVSSVLPLAAPFNGTVIGRDAVVGDLAEVGDRLFTVADLSSLWVTLAVSERDVSRLRIGQAVEIRSASLEHHIYGEITWISSHLDETTRMAQVRAEVPNPDGLLRAGMFVDASITTDERSDSLLVPRDTVYSFEGSPFVFVRLEGDLYELRRVQTGGGAGDMTVVTAGLSDDDLVAVEQSYLLKSEFQRSRFGVGCAH